MRYKEFGKTGKSVSVLGFGGMRFDPDDERWLGGKRASDCTQCGECEKACTQKLAIREYMENIAEFLGEK